MGLTALVYRPARNSYQRVFNRGYLDERKRMRVFFRQFVRRGDLVFDIGACRGHMSELFAELGGRVVAVEPNPLLAARMEHLYGSFFTVLARAVGAAEGRATLYVGRYAGHSTLSEEWMERFARDDRWSDSVDVPVTTLDALMGQYGVPSFIKIDVEGYEPEVLRGLGQRVSLSFEYQAADLAIASACLQRLDELGPYGFNYSPAKRYGLVFRAPVTSRELLRALHAERLRNPATYGDVYALT
jgi:FkbM family methyltransferase